ncbi:50S ribosomal protein L2 [Candidatus Wolfebacteria bacterium]|nr:50S ribosomal protein L2 [Candidatus Wolfebacteria bacterium]
MKKYKPTSPGRRGMTGINYRELLSGDKPMKSLTKGRRRGSGRNAFGRITTRHRGGGVKRKFRDVDFMYTKKDIPARIETIEYDPNRSGFISRVVFMDGERKYILLPKSVAVGDMVVTSENAKITPGNRLPLKKIPTGTFIYNLELKPDAGAKIVRSAGNYAEVQSHDAGYVNVKLPSTEIRKIVDTAWATIGSVSNEEHGLVKLGKAGRSRKMGRRPTVRGSAMGSHDHPHGGGEGRAGRGHRRARSKWGKPTGKGQKTRAPKKYSNQFIVSRRKVGKRK